MRISRDAQIWTLPPMIASSPLRPVLALNYVQKHNSVSSPLWSASIYYHATREEVVEKTWRQQELMDSTYRTCWLPVRLVSALRRESRGLFWKMAAKVNEIQSLLVKLTSMSRTYFNLLCPSCIIMGIWGSWGRLEYRTPKLLNLVEGEEEESARLGPYLGEMLIDRCNIIGISTWPG